MSWSLSCVVCFLANTLSRGREQARITLPLQLLTVTGTRPNAIQPCPPPLVRPCYCHTPRNTAVYGTNTFFGATAASLININLALELTDVGSELSALILSVVAASVVACFGSLIFNNHVS